MPVNDRLVFTPWLSPFQIHPLPVNIHNLETRANLSLHSL